MESNNTKQVIVIRKDLNMRKGKMIAQGAHASMKVILDKMQVFLIEDNIYRDLTMSHDNPMNLWLSDKFTKIVVSVNSELELLTLRDECLYHRVPHALIKDAGLTEFKGVETYTCLAVGPETNDKIDVITEGLPLL